MNRLKLQLTVYAEQKKKNQIRYTKEKKNRLNVQHATG
jgi:hypothetical protein